MHFDGGYAEILLHFERPFENFGPSKRLKKAPHTIIILGLVPQQHCISVIAHQGILEPGADWGNCPP